MTQQAFRIDGLDEISRHPLRLNLRLVEIAHPDLGNLLPLDELRAPQGFLSAGRDGVIAPGSCVTPTPGLVVVVRNQEETLSDRIRGRQTASTCCQAQAFSSGGWPAA